MRRYLTRLFWKMLGRPHWNVYKGKGSWVHDELAIAIKGGDGTCEFCGQYAALQFMRMEKCPVGPYSYIGEEVNEEEV